MEASDLLDPHPDVTALFCYYNDIYFQGKLGACSVQWSSPRMTLCAGICKYSYCGGCEIRLSEPLLKYRSVSDLKNTLLHEMIHAFLFLTDGNKDHDDHGQYFRAKMKEINDSQLPDFERPAEGYHVTVFHNFTDEVDNYRVHHWRCQSCGSLVKRAMNRPPSASDCVFKRPDGTCSHPRCLWHTHEKTCGGTYLKVAEPPGFKDKKRKAPKSEGTEPVAGDSKAAGKRKAVEKAKEEAKNPSIKAFFGKGRKLIETTDSQGSSGNTNTIDLTSDEPASRMYCPSCSRSFVGDLSKSDFNAEFNQHLDSCLNNKV